MKPLGIERGKTDRTKRPALRQRLARMLSAQYPPAEADHLALLFLEHLFQMPYTRAKMEERILSRPQLHQLRSMLSRSLDQEPWQYILGEAPFDVLSLEVTPAVLIPRPETEELLGWACAEIRKSFPHEKPLSMLDMGTGSGCLALGLKYHFPEAGVSAVDISEEALEVARRNARRNKLDINFFRSDILLLPPSGIKRVDVIISNPPYVMWADKAAMQPNVLAWEPWNALFAPESDPLRFYRAILDWADELLRPSALLFLEIHEKAGPAMQDLLGTRAYQDVRIQRDFREKDRFCMARKG